MKSSFCKPLVWKSFNRATGFQSNWLIGDWIENMILCDVLTSQFDGMKYFPCAFFQISALRLKLPWQTKLKWCPQGRLLITSQDVSGIRTLAFICIGLASETDVIQLTSKGKQRHVLCVSRSCKQGEAISDWVKSAFWSKRWHEKVLLKLTDL